MIERVSGVSPSAFSPDNPASLARALDKEIKSFVTQFHSPATIDLEQLASTIQSLNDLSQQAEKC